MVRYKKSQEFLRADQERRDRHPDYDELLEHTYSLLDQIIKLKQAPLNTLKEENELRLEWNQTIEKMK